MRKLIWIGCLLYLLNGLAHVVVGSVLEQIVTHYGQDYAAGGQLIFNQFAGFLAGVLIAPIISRRLGSRGTLLVALISLTLGETVYSFLPAWGVMLTVAPFAGFGFGIVEAIIGALIIEFVKERTASTMSKLEVFFGLGALLMPAIASVYIANGAWYAAFPTVAVVSLISTLLWLFLSFGKMDHQLARKTAKEAAIAASRKYDKRSIPLLVLMMLFFLLYVGIEMSFVNFVPSILINHVQATPEMATTGITIFWIAMSTGRLFAGAIAERTGYIRYLLISCLGTTVLLVGFTSVGVLWGSYVVIALLGLLMSGMFAIALVFTNKLIPNMTERTTSLLVAAGGVGGALLPRLIGWTMDSFATAVTQWLLVGLTIVMLLTMATAGGLISSKSVSPNIR